MLQLFLSILGNSKYKHIIWPGFPLHSKWNNCELCSHLTWRGTNQIFWLLEMSFWNIVNVKNRKVNLDNTPFWQLYTDRYKISYLIILFDHFFVVLEMSTITRVLDYRSVTKFIHYFFSRIYFQRSSFGARNKINSFLLSAFLMHKFSSVMSMFTSV